MLKGRWNTSSSVCSIHAFADTKKLFIVLFLFDREEQPLNLNNGKLSFPWCTVSIITRLATRPVK